MDQAGDNDILEGPLWWRSIKRQLNFYRIHVIYYIFTPILFSAIFYASNGRYHISYIDSLFNCVSAMTVCGLVTVNLSSLTTWQQVILFIQMCIGNPIIVSWVVVYQRRHYFSIKFRHILKADLENLARSDKPAPSTWSGRITTLFRGRHGKDGKGAPVVTVTEFDGIGGKKNSTKQLRPDMIRRVDDEPKRINPSGHAVPLRKMSTVHPTSHGHLTFAPPGHELEHSATRNSATLSDRESRIIIRRLSDPGVHSKPSSPASNYNRTQTVEFAPSAVRHRGKPVTSRITQNEISEHSMAEHEHVMPRQEHGSASNRSLHSRRVPLLREPSLVTGHTRSTYVAQKDFKLRGFGGFPMPFDIIAGVFARLFPKIRRKFTSTVTMPMTMSLVSQQRDVPPGAKAVPYISFNAVVGRNSAFRHLTHEEMEELGGVEYRALNALLWIIGGYHVITQLIVFIVIAPYISTPKWRENFVPPAEIRPQNPVWFSLFQVASAYTNNGMSLVDHSMVPFQTAYPMIILMGLLILAGNTAFPVFLRFTIWVLTKLVRRGSRANETLHFLLDHPRRCFIFLFPSHQTWFLLTVVIGLTVTGWFFFLVLNIGNPEVEAIPLGIRFLIGLFQAVAVRSAGFSAVSIATLASAVQFLYVVMMYISVYPIAMRGVSSSPDFLSQMTLIQYDETDEMDFQPAGPRVTVWSQYLALHARKQLAFDMWWLGLALFLVCINERHNLDDPSSAVWFNIFSVVFEIVSAYGTVGLSLGTPNNNFSLAGELKSLSKFILCLVMIRGRHRMLPVAIDRAVMLPSELQRQLDQNADSTHMSGGHATQEDEAPIHDQQNSIVKNENGSHEGHHDDGSVS